MPDLPKSKEYKFAEDVIAVLKTHDRLCVSVLENPYDSDDQVSKLIMASQQYSLAIAVMPRVPEFIWDSVDMPKAGIIQLTVAILIITTQNVVDEPAGRRIADTSESIISYLYNWSRTDDDIPYVDPWFTGCSPLDTTEIEGLENTVGRVLTLSVRTRI